MLGRSISKNSAILATFAAITAALIAFTFQSTQARIVDAERRAAQQALFEIVPPSRHDNDLLGDTLTLPPDQTAQLNMPERGRIHVARSAGEPIALIIPTTATDGYSGDIRLLVGVNLDGSLSGVRVVSHRETPGLGDKIELSKNKWILGFDTKSLVNPVEEKWRVKKDGGDFDQFAGATITPRAVVNQVKNVLQFVNAHREELQQRTRANGIAQP
jgi:Na+-translocating ferredoxin:NAD+ oxidoreductase subunit G